VGNFASDIAQLSSEAKLPTKYGQFKIQIYVNKITDEETAVLIKGDLEKNDDVLVRLHSECLTGDTFASERCDCGPQLHKAMEMIEKEGSGIIVYLRQEGRGIGLCNKIKAYSLQDNGRDTVEANIELGFEADSRNYSFAAKILEKLGVKSIKLMTNNPEKIKGVENCGIKVNERVLINPGTNVHNVDYLQTKKEKMGHMI